MGPVPTPVPLPAEEDKRTYCYGGSDGKRHQFSSRKEGRSGSGCPLGTGPSSVDTYVRQFIEFCPVHDGPRPEAPGESPGLVGSWRVSQWTVQKELLNETCSVHDLRLLCLHSLYLGDVGHPGVCSVTYRRYIGLWTANSRHGPQFVRLLPRPYKSPFTFFRSVSHYNLSQNFPLIPEEPIYVHPRFM